MTISRNPSPSRSTSSLTAMRAPVRRMISWDKCKGRDGLNVGYMGGPGQLWFTHNTHLDHQTSSTDDGAGLEINEWKGHQEVKYGLSRRLLGGNTIERGKVGGYIRARYAMLWVGLDRG